MARTRNQAEYDAARTRLLEVGEGLIRSGSYSAVGINDVLRSADVPKGSFYHYFESKEAFGLAVAEYYHAGQVAEARAVLEDETLPARVRIRRFFEGARDEFARREFADGCLMCNLSVELGDTNDAFQSTLSRHWRALSDVLASCIELLEPGELFPPHVRSSDAADWLLSAWTGALTRMKAERSERPLELFFSVAFPPESPSKKA